MVKPKLIAFSFIFLLSHFTPHLYFSDVAKKENSKIHPLFIWKKFVQENRLKVFPNLGSSCQIIYSFHISTHFIKYLLHAGNCGLWDKSLYLLIAPLCAKHYSKYLINERGLFSFTGRNWNLRRLTNSISTFIKQDKKGWRSDLNLGRMSWAPKCLTVIFLCLNKM